MPPRNSRKPDPDSQPPDDAATYLQSIAEAAASKVIGEALVAFSETLRSEVLPEFHRAVVAEVQTQQAQPLNEEAIVQKVAAILNERAEATAGSIGNRLQQVEEVLTQIGMRATPTTPTDAAQPPQSQPQSTTVTLGQKSFDTAPLAFLIDQAINKIVKVLEVRSLLSNPFTMAQKIRNEHPEVLPMYAYAFAPPTHEQMMMAYKMAGEGMMTGLRTRVETMKGFQQGGSQWPGIPSSGLPSSSEGNPAWYGGPTPPQSPPQNVPQPGSGPTTPRIATMSESQNGPGPQVYGQGIGPVYGPNVKPVRLQDALR